MGTIPIIVWMNGHNKQENWIQTIHSPFHLEIKVRMTSSLPSLD